MDTCIKAGSYCPVCKGVVGRDCWHDASEFKRGANYAEEFFAAKDEIESLRQQLASAQEELHFQACLTKALMPYQERALKSEQQLAAALAACEAKDDCLLDCAGNINPERGYADELELDIAKALTIKPDSSALKVHDDALIERCAELTDAYITVNPHHSGALRKLADAIRELKSQL